MKLLKYFISIFLISSLTYSCSNDSGEGKLENITYDVLLWEFTPDTGNDTQRLQWEIEFHNPNNVTITGFYRITQNADGLVATILSTNLSSCYQIEANSSCTVSFDGEDSHNIAMTNSIDLVSIEYNIEN